MNTTSYAGTIESKHCSKCDRDLPTGDFHRATRNPDGLQSWCKACADAARRLRMADPAAKVRDAAKSRAWAAAHHEGRLAYGKARYAERRAEYLAYNAAHRADKRAWWIKREYNLTPDQYAGMLAAQGGMCAICEWADESKPLHVDHNHETGAVRGLLCGSCNHALGMMLDNPDLMRTAAAYVEGAP